MVKQLKSVFSVLSAAVLALSLIAQAHAQGQPPTMLDIWADVTPRELSDKEFSDVLSIMKEFDEKDVDLDIDDDERMPAKEEQLAAVKANPEAMAIIGSHGYTPDSLYPIMINAMISFGAAEMAGHEAEMAMALAQLEAMKGQIPDEQYNLMMQQVGGGMEAIDRVPPGNIELAKKYKTEFEQISDD